VKGFYKTNKYFQKLSKKDVGTEEDGDWSQSELEREGERAAKVMTASLFSSEPQTRGVTIERQ
jgi:hypothetical protein